MKQLHSMILIAVLLLAAVSLWAGAAATPAGAAPERLPPNAEPFFCYDTSVSSNSTWEEPQSCFSDALGTNPFSNGLPSGKLAIITDFEATPQSTAAGNYYFGISEATPNGSLRDPRLLWRQDGPNSFQVHTLAPLFSVTSGNEIRVWNSTSSPASMRIYIQGFIVDDLTYTPTAINNLRVTVAANSSLLQIVALLLLVGLIPITWRQSAHAPAGKPPAQ